ncbi:GNAT family N-acetyltransferase [Yoonia sp.]|uniref:GNAT family N-acetyltransferase n=1 Tax=Yoonia sp. TaxID=2212373 RepID=UPI0035C7E1D3
MVRKFIDNQPIFEVQLAKKAEDIRAAQRLRYAVFVNELGAGGDNVDHHLQLERDQFDPFAAHLLLRDISRPAGDDVVGVYRLMTRDMADEAGGFYCAQEFDLSPLHEKGGRLLELGRSCLHPDYRGGEAMLHLWGGLTDYVEAHGIETLFGVASFHGTDTAALAPALALLHERHLAPPFLRVTAKGSTAFFPGNRAANTDRLATVRLIPSLIKAYLRLGGCIGEGVFVDHDFNTTDVCLILQRDAINALQGQLYTTGAQRG